MTTRNAVRHAISSGHAREVKATLTDNEQVRLLRQCLVAPDRELIEHLRRLADELADETSQKSGAI